MLNRHIFTSSNIFLLLGIALFVVALVAFPTRVEFVDQQAPGHSEDYSVGWLFAPIIGVWGLASLALGLVQSTRPNGQVAQLLLLLSLLVCVGLSFAAYMVIVYGFGIVASVGRGEPLFLLYFGLVLAPSLIILTSTVKFLRAGERAIFQVSKQVKAAVFVVLAAVPVTYSAAFLAYLFLF
jgi:hypothetical protein